MLNTSKFYRRNRLRTPAEFRQVFRNARKLKTPHLAIFYTPNDLTHARLGIVIAKRNIKTAVARNRAKRLLRESFRNNINSLAVDLVVVVYKSAEQLTNEEFYQCIKQCWQKLISRCK